MASIRLGTASPSTQASTAETLALLTSIATRAAAQSVDILLLPEAFIGGYPDEATSSSTSSNREAFAAYFDRAVDLGDTCNSGAGADGTWLRRELSGSSSGGGLGGDDQSQQRGDGTREQLEKIATDSGVLIVTGLVEKVGGSLYSSVVYVCPTQGIIGKRRKIHPTGNERLFWAQGAPSTLRAVSTVIRGVRLNLAAALSWESCIPLVRQALYSQNVNLYLAPRAVITDDESNNWLSSLQSVGFEGRCFVIGSSGGGGSGDSTREVNGINGAHHGEAVDEESDGRLPPLPSLSPQRRRRRKSVFDEDGNEIVLCCPADGEDTNDSAPTGLNGHSRGRRQATAAHGKTSTGRGGSFVIGPYGNVLADQSSKGGEDIVYTDVDFRDCIRGRLDLDVTGGYHDSFKFSVEGLSLDPLPY